VQGGRTQFADHREDFVGSTPDRRSSDRFRLLPSEHRLNTIKRRAEVQDENAVSSIARTRLTKTLCALLSIESHLGKLPVVCQLKTYASR
jgi:hypothetical protein